MKPTGTVLVLRALGLGDLCTAVPALRALRRAAPDGRLVLAAPAWQEPLARLAGVDEVVDTAPLTPLDGSVHHADLAVNLHGRGPQSTTLLAATHPKRMIAFAHADVDAETVSDVAWRPDEHEVHRWCRLLTSSGVDAEPDDLRLPPPGDVGDGVVIVHPGAAARARRWPPERFGAVVAALARRGARVALTGTADERPLCDDVVAAAGAEARPAVDVLAGTTGLMELAAAVAGASLVIANDTGVAHLATAFGTPSVVLFGPTPPSEWGPPDTAVHRALWSGRRGDPHSTELDPGLELIEVADVLEAAEEVTARVPA